MPPDSVKAFTTALTDTSVGRHAPNELLPWVEPRGGSGEPAESPLKVWNGTEWISTGITVED